MTRALQSLNRYGEFALVAVVCLGPLLGRQLLGYGASASNQPLFSDAKLIQLVVIELLAGGVAVLILRTRGHGRSEVRWGITGSNTLVGLALLVAYYLAFVILYAAMSYVVSVDSGGSNVAGGTVTWPVVVLASLVNPVFEEMLFIWYVVQVFGTRGFAVSMAVGVGMRLLVHVSHGMVAVPTTVPLGILFMAIYWRRRQMWPIVLAHALADAIGLARLVDKSSS